MKTETCPHHVRRNPACHICTSISESLIAQLTAEYIVCYCSVCGWRDGFLEEVIKGITAHGYCDECREEREFRRTA